jgi:hypothetical protein
MLKCIIEHGDGCAEVNRFGNSGDTALFDNYRNLWIQPRVNERLVAAITAKHDRGSLTATRKLTGKPRGKRRLSGSADGEISNTHHRDRRFR